MKRLLFLFCLACIWSLSACSNSEGFSYDIDPKALGNDKDIDLLADMLPMKSNGATVVLGTSSPDANATERPAMSVKLDYDFYLSRHEVTCGEFRQVMGSAMDFYLECSNDSLPVTDITFFDAVLFANESSKKAGLDTAYTYLSKVLDAEHHCVGLEGLVYHPEIEAFRLPTEAEWVFAAKQNWNAEQAWTVENSDNKLHPVCAKTAEGGLCDMMGNVMEWVNDWLGHFRDTLVLDYVGAPDGGMRAERVVKGGSFHDRGASITLHARGDVYTITSSSRTDYVGFRLAYGSIPNAAWMGDNGMPSPYKIMPLANSASLHRYSRTYKSKLAFRNDISGNIAFMDYSNGSQTVVEIMDTIQSFHPEISPDGKRIAFCSKFEGMAGKSELYVRDLNEKGSNLVKLDVESAAIPRWRVLDTGDTSIIYVTDAGNNRNGESFRSASTWQVTFANGKFGTPQKLFDGAYHGGISSDNRLSVTGARVLRARIADPVSTLGESARDTVWYNGEQACNVSLSKDASKRTLFLDFASSTGREFAGKTYATHERIFVMDSTGRLIHSVQAPEGYSFDHVEWAFGGSDYAVATLTNLQGAHTRIVLVDVFGDGSVLPLAQGDELWHPSLWSADASGNLESENLDLDSACVYMTENSDITTAIMKTKMDLFWQYREIADAVVIGSSRSFAGVDPEHIASHFAINMSYSNEDLTATRFFVENYILPLMPKLKVIVLALDYDRWFMKDGNWKKWFSDIPGYEYDRNHGFWKDGEKGDMYAVSMNTLSPNENDYFLYTYHRGLYYSTTEGWSDYPKASMDPMWFDKDNSGLQYNLYTLSKILELAKAAGVRVVGVVFPQSPLYAQTGAWGRYGPTHTAIRVIKDAANELPKKYPNFVIMDEYQDGAHDYPCSVFSNDDHLNLKGAQILTERLEKLLASW